MANKLKDVESSIQQKLGSLNQSPIKHCIYKVPEPIRTVKIDSYEPSVVAIGPFYCKKESLWALQELKLRHLQCFLEFSSRTRGVLAHSFGEYIEYVGQREEDARWYYSEEIELSSNEFIEMVIVDAAFIIYLFIWCDHQFSLNNYPIENKLEMLHHIQHDLFLIENQLPFFILNDLYDKAFGASYPNVSFKDLTLNFIGKCGVFATEATLKVKERLRDASEIKHLVDFLSIYCLPSSVRSDQLTQPKIEEKYRYPPTAKELKAAGVKFVTTEDQNMLDITFVEGVLQIPKLTIQDNTESIFRNLLFFDYCHYYSDTYFLDYMVFLDELINTPEDVQVLTKSGILESWLGSDEEVASMINKIVKHIMINNNKFFYADVSQRLNIHASKRRHKWIAILKRDYFNHPWSIISVIYLVVLLVLTVLQVVSGFK